MKPAEKVGLIEGGGVYDFGDVKIVTVHGELVKEAKEETAGRFGGRGWRFAEEKMRT